MENPEVRGGFLEEISIGFLLVAGVGVGAPEGMELISITSQQLRLRRLNISKSWAASHSAVPPAAPSAASVILGLILALTPGI